MQLADFLETELRHAQQLEDAGRILRAQLVEILRLAGARDLFDHFARGFADAGDVVDRAGLDQRIDGAFDVLHRARGFLEGFGLERIGVGELDVAGDLVEGAGDRELVHRLVIIMRPCKLGNGWWSLSMYPRVKRSCGSSTSCAARWACSRSDCRRSSPTG